MKRVGIIFLLAVSLLFSCGYSFSENTEVSTDVNLFDYILGPGDKVEIKVYRNEDLDYTVQIDPSGKISYPLLGDVHAAGMTIYQLRDRIANGLAKFLKDPQVTVNLSSYQSHKVTVLGGVANQGIFSIDRQPTILEIISRSGGFASTADKSNVVVIRKQQGGSIALRLDVKKALQGDKTHDILLKGDDIVYVPADTNKLTIIGEVASPGVMSLEREQNDLPVTILDVIIKAGGFSSSADKTKVVIIRKEGDKVETKRFNIKKVLEEGDLAQNVVVQKGDILYVPKIDQKVIVMGEVASPGSIQFDSPVKILDILSKAGGISANANKNNVLIIRNDDGESKLIAVDIQKALDKGDISQNPFLQNGDIVYVPRDNKKVIVLGEVGSPGYYSYTDPLTIVDAISKSGGFTNKANEQKVVVLREGAAKIVNFLGIIKEGNIEQNIVLQNGDIVYVPTTFIAEVEAFLGHIQTIFSTFGSIESSVIMWPQFKSVIKGGGGTGTIIVPSQ